MILDPTIWEKAIFVIFIWPILYTYHISYIAVICTISFKSSIPLSFSNTSIFEVRKALSSTVLPFKHVGVLCCRYYSFPFVYCSFMYIDAVKKDCRIGDCRSMRVTNDLWRNLFLAVMVCLSHTNYTHLSTLSLFNILL